MAKMQNQTVPENPVGKVIVQLPFIPPGEVYCPRSPDISLSPAEARTLKGIALALAGAGERLADGRKVTDEATAIRWILAKAGA